MKFFKHKNTRLQCTSRLENKRQNNRTVKVNWITLGKKFLFLFCVIFLIFWIGISCKQNHVFPIKKIQIVASFSHLDEATIKQIVAPYLQYSFFAFNAQDLSKDLMQLAWVHSVSVQRIWPDKIVINLVEQNPVAIWNANFLLNSEGEIFSPAINTFPQNLPRLFGPEIELHNVFINYFLISTFLKPFGYVVNQLTVDSHRNWSLTLANGLYLFLGQKSIMSRLKIFTDVYPKIKNPHHIARKIDLRYNEGLSIEWQ